jgi:hypothetical protein
MKPPMEDPTGLSTGRPPGMDVRLDVQLQNALGAPLLQVPADFAARVMAALPSARALPSPAGAVQNAPATPRWLAALRVAVLAACGAGGAFEVFSYVVGLWSASAVALG